jgi:hypothetical protein
MGRFSIFFVGKGDSIAVKTEVINSVVQPRIKSGA